MQTSIKKIYNIIKRTTLFVLCKKKQNNTFLQMYYIIINFI